MDAKRMLAEQRKMDALRDLIEQTSYMKASAVRKHLNMSRATLAGIPREVLPWVPGSPSERGVERRYHPADVAAYPARARRWNDAVSKGTEVDVLEAMRAELAERDAAAIHDALSAA